jgi:hypothetical protein
MIKSVIYLISIVLVCAVCKVEADIVWIDFFDGQVHEINSGNSTGEEEIIRVDYGYPGVGTTLDIVVGGKIREDCLAFENSKVNLLGGEITGNLFVSDNCRAVVYGGSIGEFLHSHSNSWVTVLGGVVGTEVDAFDNSRIDISGGIFSYVRSDGYGQLNISGGIFSNELRATQDSIMTIYGTDFAIDGISVGYGPITAASGVLTGTLASGELINNDFYVFENADIILVPEPGTVLLLGLGALAISPRRRQNKKE